MDRRKAIARIAASGAGAVGAATIISSPAFAGFTVNPPTPSISFQKLTGQTGTIAISGLASGCGGSAVSSSVSTSVTAIKNSATVIHSAGGITTSTYSAESTAAGSWKTGDTVLIKVCTTASCTYPGGSSSATRQWTQNFVGTGNGNSASFALSGSTTTANVCG